MNMSMPYGGGGVQVAQAVPVVQTAVPVPGQPVPTLQQQAAPSGLPGGHTYTRSLGAAQYQRAPSSERGGRAWGGGGAPALRDLHNSNAPDFPLQMMKVEADVHMASMFVRMEGSWTVQGTSPSCVALFKLPTSSKATITACGITVGARIFRTAVIPQADTAQFDGKGPRLAPSGASAAADENLSKIGEYDPTCFRLPIPGLQAGETVTVVVQYLPSPDFLYPRAATLTAM
jgi:hypothetical protein